jgi:hypothetical protein
LVAILTLEETLAVQNDLDQLYSDRELKTSEIFAPNAFYGIDRVLKGYAGIPPWYSLKAVVPHGLVLNPAHVWEAEPRTGLPAVACYPPYREAAYTHATGMRVVQSAAPFAYVAAMLKQEASPPRCGGST